MNTDMFIIKLTFIMNLWDAGYSQDDISYICEIPEQFIPSYYKMASDYFNRKIQMVS